MWIDIIDENKQPKLVNLDCVSCIFPADDGVHLVMADGCVLISISKEYYYDKLCEILTKTSTKLC